MIFLLAIGYAMPIVALGVVIDREVCMTYNMALLIDNRPAYIQVPGGFDWIGARSE